MTHVLTARTYINADRSRVVDEGTPDAAYLLGDEGDEVTDEVAASLGLGDDTGGLDDMKKDELVAYAEEHGIEVDSKAKVADVRAAIVAASD